MANLGDALLPGAQDGSGGNAGDMLQQTAQGWKQWLANPVNSSFLLNTGLGLMMPSWGTGAAPIAEAISGGAAAAGKVSKNLEDNEREDAKQRISQGNSAANRANALEIARLGADSRADVANIRAAAMLQARELTQGAKTPEEQRFWQKEFDNYIDDKIKAVREGNKSLEKMLHPDPEPGRDAFANEAAQHANNVLIARRAQFQAGGSGLGLSGTGGKAGAQGTEGGGQSAVPPSRTVAETPAGRFAPPAAGGDMAETAAIQQKLKDPELLGQLEAMSKSPSGMEQLKKNRIGQEFLRRKGMAVGPGDAFSGP